MVTWEWCCVITSTLYVYFVDPCHPYILLLLSWKCITVYTQKQLSVTANDYKLFFFSLCLFRIIGLLVPTTYLPSHFYTRIFGLISSVLPHIEREREREVMRLPTTSLLMGLHNCIRCSCHSASNMHINLLMESWTSVGSSRLPWPHICHRHISGHTSTGTVSPWATLYGVNLQYPSTDKSWCAVLSGGVMSQWKWSTLYSLTCTCWL